MSAGELSALEHTRLKAATHRAEQSSGLEFSVYLGAVEGEPRAYAEQLHARLERSEDAVLVLCDPGARALEIITGPMAARRLSDHDCHLAAVSMQTSFAAGDFVGGLCQGVLHLADRATRPETLHVTEQV